MCRRTLIVLHSPYCGHKTVLHSPYCGHKTVLHCPYCGHKTVLHSPYCGHKTVLHSPYCGHKTVLHSPYSVPYSVAKQVCSNQLYLEPCVYRCSAIDNEVVTKDDRALCPVDYSCFVCVY